MLKRFSGEVITSRQNLGVISACKLSEKKHRDSEGKFRIDGIKLFEEAVASGVDIETVFLRRDSLDKLEKRIGGLLEKISNVDVKVLSEGVFEKISEEKSPEGIICVVKRIDKLHKIVTINKDGNAKDEIVPPADAKIFAVESVRDPGNMGTIMRSAAAFGVDTLVISRDCADIYNPKTVRGAMGALFKMNIFVFDDIRAAIECLKSSGRRVYAAALDKTAVSLDKVAFGKGDTAIVGNEGHGLSPETVSACTQSLYIPMEEGSESLNAGVAASVILWKMYRG